MNILRGISELSSLPGPIVLAVGVFDGVHLGHQELVRTARETAEACSGTLVLTTFDPHPLRFLRPDNAPHLLTATAHKLNLLAEKGVKNVLLLRFDEALATLRARDFVEGIVAASRPLHAFCVGHSWTFGKGREGNIETLRAMGEEMGFQVIGISPILVEGEPVSSTRIRRAVERGDFATAAKCLGREYRILGTVVEGAGLGRKIGFPTANLAAHNEQFPPNGVYAVRCYDGDQKRNGVANIGTRPTVTQGAGERVLEIHIFDTSENLYGRDVEVEFVHFLRPEQKFDGLDALQKQIASDAETARKILGV